MDSTGFWPEFLNGGKEISMTNPITITLRSNVYPRMDYWDAIQKMANRMAFSQQKYGDLEENYPSISAYKNIQERLWLYLETGNTEHLLDAANFCVIEHLIPSHERAHFRATGSEESPGLVDEPVKDNCSVCDGLMYWIECPTGNWWKHAVHPDDDHDATL